MLNTQILHVKNTRAIQWCWSPFL